MGMENLIKLQQLDLSILNMQRKVDSIPKDIEKLRKEKEEILSRSNEIKEKLRKKIYQQKEYEMDIQKYKDRIDKIDKDLINVKTNQEYKELLKMKAQYEKDIIDTEDKILELMEELEELEKEKKILEKKLEEEVKDIDKKIEEKEREIEATKKILEDLYKQKEEFKKDIEPNLLKRYELIKNRVKDGVVIASVDDNICTGCYMIIPPKLLNELIKNKDKLHQCPNCGRFLYFKE